MYRTLDVLEELGYLSHSHSAAGREEFHVLPEIEHGHLQCRTCGRTWELPRADAAAVVAPIRTRFGFVADVGHLADLRPVRRLSGPSGSAPAGVG